MRRAVLAAILMLTASVAAAQTVSFDGSWQEQGFLRLSSNDYQQNGRSLDVRSDGTVSVLYRRLPESAGDADAASWSWSVTEGVPPTDLTRKGGDDRNLAVYFVFADAGTAADLRGEPLRELLSASGVRALIYVWGGSAARGTVRPSPYFDGRAATIVLRGAGTGEHSETVDLSADLNAAFGSRPGVLLGVAVSADSDDTDSVIVGTISDLSLR